MNIKTIFVAVFALALTSGAAAEDTIGGWRAECKVSVCTWEGPYQKNPKDAWADAKEHSAKWQGHDTYIMYKEHPQD